MKKIKKPISVLLAVIMVVSLFTIMPITVNAADFTDFLPVSSSGTATGYFTYNNHFYKVYWFGINTTETTTVKLIYALENNRLRAYRNGNDSSGISLVANSNNFWNISDITNLTPGQSSDG